MQWPPAYKKIILDEGDAQATHNGARGEIQINIQGIQPGEQSPDDIDDINEEQLDPWLEYLQDLDVNSKLDSILPSDDPQI